MAGALQRPRSELYANVPYISGSTGGTTGQEVSEEKELEHAEDYLVPIVEQIVQNVCLELIPSDVEANDETGAFMKEMGKAGSWITRTGLLSEDMQHNCFEWQRTKADNLVSARKGSVERRGEISGRFFDWHYAEASDRINAVCAEYLSP